MISKTQKEQIIEYYLECTSRDQISSNVGVSTGSVSNVIQEWKKSMDSHDIEEIRQFIKLSRKAGMTIRQCSEGFRMSKLIDKLGIGEIGNANFNQDKFSEFVNEFYDICQSHQITPNILVSWFNDLVDLSTINWKLENSNSDINQFNQRKDELKKGESVPVVKLISHHIEKKKGESDILEKKKGELTKDIEFLNTKRDQLRSNILSLKQERDHFISLYNSFIELESILRERSDIDLNTDLEIVFNLIYGFNEQGYDLRRIIATYNVATGLDWNIDQKKNSIISLEGKITKLQNDINVNESLLSLSRRKLDIMHQLDTMKFDFEVLKQLWLTVSEITSSRKIDSYDAVSLFIKDVEENYHDKLLFQDRVVQKKKELETATNQLNFNRKLILAHPVIGTSMSRLYRNGITEEDIVELVQLFQNSLQERGLYNKESIGAERKGEVNSNGISHKISEWKVLAEELKKYNGIKEAIRHSTMNLNRLRDEYAVLIKDFKGLSDLCQTASHLVNILNSYFFYFKGYFDQIHRNNSSNNNFNITVNNVLVPLILLASHHYPENNQTEKESEKEKENGSQDQDISQNNKKKKAK